MAKEEICSKCGKTKSEHIMRERYCPDSNIATDVFVPSSSKVKTKKEDFKSRFGLKSVKNSNKKQTTHIKQEAEIKSNVVSFVTGASKREARASCSLDCETHEEIRCPKCGEIKHETRAVILDNNPLSIACYLEERCDVCGQIPDEKPKNNHLIEKSIELNKAGISVNFDMQYKKNNPYCAFNEVYNSIRDKNNLIDQSTHTITELKRENTELLSSKKELDSENNKLSDWIDEERKYSHGIEESYQSLKEDVPKIEEENKRLREELNAYKKTYGETIRSILTKLEKYDDGNSNALDCVDQTLVYIKHLESELEDKKENWLRIGSPELDLLIEANNNKHYNWYVEEAKENTRLKKELEELKYKPNEENELASLVEFRVMGEKDNIRNEAKREGELNTLLRLEQAVNKTEGLDDVLIYRKSEILKWITKERQHLGEPITIERTRASELKECPKCGGKLDQEAMHPHDIYCTQCCFGAEPHVMVEVKPETSEPKSEIKQALHLIKKARNAMPKGEDRSIIKAIMKILYCVVRKLDEE